MYNMINELQEIRKELMVGYDNVDLLYIEMQINKIDTLISREVEKEKSLAKNGYFIPPEKHIENNSVSYVIDEKINQFTTIENYIENVKKKLNCNASEDYCSEFITYNYTNEQVLSHVDYFDGCRKEGMSAYKALLFFGDYLGQKGDLRWTDEHKTQVEFVKNGNGKYIIGHDPYLRSNTK